MMGADQSPSTSLDDSILSYIRCMQCSSSKSPIEKQYQSISKKQIYNFFTIDYDTTTTKKDVKYSLKRLVKRGIISKDDMEYSYIQPHQISIDSSISSDKGYHSQVDKPPDDVATEGGSIEHSAAMSRGDIEQPSSLDDAILFYIRESCQTSTSRVQTFISKNQIQKYYDCIVKEYDTTKKDVKHTLKRLIKRRAIVKDGQKKYSYIKPWKSIDICTIITDSPKKRKRQSEVEESSEHESAAAAATEPTTVKKRCKPKCSVDGCNSFSRTGYSVCTNHGAKTYKYTCSHVGCSNKVENSGVCVKHGAKMRICKRDGCSNKVQSKGVCFKHGAIRPPRRKCEVEGCNKNAQRLGVCCTHGAYAYR